MAIARKPVGQLRHPVAVAHPDRIALALSPRPLEQGGVLRDQHLGASELAVMAGLHRPAELQRHRLLAVADAEDRHAGPVDRPGRQRRVLIEHGSRAARQDHALRTHRREARFGLGIGNDLAIDLLLAHAPRDQLGHLRAEVDDQDLVVAGRSVRRGVTHEGGIENRHLQYLQGAARPVKIVGRRSPQAP